MMGILCAFAGLAIAASAESRSSTSKNDSCSQTRNALGKGMDIKNITRDNIREGHDTCSVIRCAITSGGQPRRVIAGAKEAGVSSHAASRCAVDACAEAGRLLESTNNVCSIIRSDISRGVAPRKVIRDRIRAGNNACTAIKCAIASDTDLRQVFAGAKDAGITSDVIARCAVDACVDPAMVAAVEQDIGIYGLGYAYYDEDFIPKDTTLPRKGNAQATESGDSFREIFLSAANAYPEGTRLFESSSSVYSVTGSDWNRSVGNLFRTGRGTEGRVLSPSKFPPSL